MKRLLFMELRDAKPMLAFLAFILVTVGIVMGFLLRRAGEGFSFAISGMVGSMVLPFIPLVTLQMQNQQRGKNKRISTLASLPIDRVRLAISRYLAPASLQLAIGALVILSSFFDTHRAFEPLGMISSVVNGAFVGLSLMALGLLIIDFFPKTTTTVGSSMWLAIVLFPRGKSFDWLVDHLTSPSFLMPTMAAALLVMVAEVMVFSRRASFA